MTYDFLCNHYYENGLIHSWHKETLDSFICSLDSEGYEPKSIERNFFRFQISKN